MIKLKQNTFVDLIPKNFENEKVVVLIGHLIGFFGYYNSLNEIDFLSSDIKINENFKKLLLRSKNNLKTYIICEDEECDYWKKLISYGNNSLIKIFKGKLIRCIPQGFKRKNLNEEYISSALKTIMEKEKMSNNSMLVIMNPPYGKQGTLCIPIIKKVRELSNNIEVLAPQNIFFKGDLAKFADSFEVIDNVFENVNICELSIVHLIDKEVNKYNKEDVSLPVKDLSLAKAIKKYNETHKRTWEKLTGWNRYDPKKKMSEAAKNSFDGVVSDDICEEIWKQGRLFQSTTWTPSNGVHQDKNTWDYKCNYDNLYPFGMGARPKTDRILDAFVFETKNERNHFMRWWYSCCEGKYNANSLTNRILHIIEKSVSRSAGAKGYITYFPYLDWTKEWKDEEILEEIGLPKDFLEKDF